MVQISLTDFVDFASKSGTPKQTKVRQIKERDSYSPAMDFWKPLREKIIEMNQNGEEKSTLNDLINQSLHKTKLKNYPGAIEGYQKFLGKKEVEWFDPPIEHWKYKDLDIKINPEAGLIIKGQPFIIKFHFKKEPLAKNRVQTIIQLMELNLKGKCDDNCEFAVLDIQKSKLLKKDQRMNDIDVLINAEAESFLTLWNNI